MGGQREKVLRFLNFIDTAPHMSKEKEDVEEVDETHQQFGISESEMKKKMRQVVDTWDVTHDSSKSGQKRTQQRVLRECLNLFGKGSMSSNAYLQRKQLGKLLSSLYPGNGPKGKNRLFTSDADTVDLPFKTEDDTTHLTPSQQVNVEDPLLSEAALTKLKTHGIVRISHGISQETVVALRIALRRSLQEKEPKELKKLTDTQGNGRNGLYFYFDDPDEWLLLLREKLTKELCPEHKEQAEETSFIGLCYGEGGINYTHQDNTATTKNKNPAIRYQALVLLNAPGKDFNGGELYVQDGRVPMTNDQREWVAPINSQTSNFACGGQAGDVVVFKANGSGGGKNGKNWYHGMTVVTKGANAVCQRWGIGLFQPPTKKSIERAKVKRAEEKRAKETGKRKRQ
jgi:hypothetical protein